MEKNKFNEKLFNFIDKSTCAFTTIETIKKELLENNYIQVYENKKWNFKTGKYFVIRNDASIIAFNIGKNHNKSFNIICTHSDTPGFKLKPKGEIYEYDYLKLNVSPYGGLLNYGWLDRPLSMSGRVLYKDNYKYKKKIIDIREPICVIPSEAIHQNSNANTNLDLNSQTDLIPILGLKKENNVIKNILDKYIETYEEICDYDLFLYNKEKPTYIGINKDIILSPRIDDLTCIFSALKAFVKSNNDNNINVMCVFNSEEVGSLTKEGADSSFLLDTLKRICASIDLDISLALHNSLIVSADNSHAVHPNNPIKSDINNQGILNKGVLIIREKETTTDSISSSIFKEICKMAQVPYQDYTSRNDMETGTTLTGLCIRHVSIDSIDVGLPQLAMHSSNEVVGSDDIYYLYKAFLKFYNILIKHNLETFEIMNNIN